MTFSLWNNSKSKNYEEIANLCDRYSDDLNEFYFNRDPYILNMILNYYQTQKLHLNYNQCMLFIKSELIYWGIEEYLLDADWSLNAGNWMWLSASAYFHQYFRVYSPIAFGKKTDPNGNYIKKYLPVLKNFPAKFIYEPWKATLAVQQQAKCLIGKDYPKPIVDHDEAKELNLQRMKAAYKK